MSAGKRSPFSMGVISKPILMLGITIVVSILAMGGILLFGATQQSYQQQYLEIVSEQKLLSQSVATLSLESAAGKSTAFSQLERFRNRFDETLVVLTSGKPLGQLPALPDALKDELDAVKNVWVGDGSLRDDRSYRANVVRILDGNVPISEVGEFVLVLQEFIPQLLSFSEEVVDLLVERKLDPHVIFMASRQLMLTQRIENNMNKVLAGGEDAAAAADRFGRDASRFGSVLEAMLKGSKSLQIKKIDDIAL